MSHPSPCKIVQLTPPGRGAVATLLVEGPGAAHAVEARFRSASGRTLASYPPGRLAIGFFDFGGRSLEEVVVRFRSRESIELCCHGGHAAVAALENALVQEGGRAVAWQRWAAEHHADPIAAAARVALADARTERAALVLLDQFEGALRAAIESIRHAITRCDTASAAEQLRSLLGRARLGRHLTEPWRVVLSGPPNVGKSSLINALVGYGRSIVHPTPGTTRDVVSTVTAVDGWPVELSDTAGLPSRSAVSADNGPSRSAISADTGRAGRPTYFADELEQAGVALGQDKAAGAELVILVFDLSRPWSAHEASLVTSRSATIVVHNKRDLLVRSDRIHAVEGESASSRLDRAGQHERKPDESGYYERTTRPAGVLTSALRGEGLDALLRAIAERLVPEAPPPGAAVPFTAEQIERLASADGALARGDLTTAETILAEM